MLNSIKSFIRETFNKHGYELQKSKLLTESDDPFFILSKLLCPNEVNSIVDAGATIGEGKTGFPPPLHHSLKFKMVKLIHKIFNTFGREYLYPNHLAMAITLRKG